MEEKQTQTKLFKGFKSIQSTIFAAISVLVCVRLLLPL